MKIEEINISIGKSWGSYIEYCSFANSLTKEQKEQVALAMLKWINKELEKK